jgi:uncharacterized protein
MSKNIISLISGIIFGIGLAISGMTDPQKVIGFLDIFGDWVPDLIFVMCSALIVSALGYQLSKRMHKPMLEESFKIPKKNYVNKELIQGAFIFGIGWGLYGLCPGPALASINNQVALVFIVSMFGGMQLANKVIKS